MAARTGQPARSATTQRAKDGTSEKCPCGVGGPTGTLCLPESDAIMKAATLIIDERATLYTIAKRWNAAGIVPTGTLRRPGA